MRHKWFLGLWLTAAGCAGKSTMPAHELTYVDHVAPILEANCVQCHSAGNIAPFSLTTYDEVKPLGGAIKLATATRKMPPWGVDNSGDCNTYRDARWLTDDEIGTLGDWVDQGMPEGRANDPKGGTALEPPNLRHVSATMDMHVGYTAVPAAGEEDLYRCFVMDPALTTDQYLTAYEVKPGERRIVHHVILYGLLTEAGETAARALDEADEGPGYTCFGGPGIEIEDFAAPNVNFLAAWAPGVPVTRYPEGTGIRMSAGHKVIMQVHYNVTAEPLLDRTSIDLELEDAVDSRGFVFPVADLDMAIAPRLEHAETTHEARLARLPVPSIQLHGVFPHMHLLGRTMRVETDRARDGETRCLVDVPSYDFHWQQFYFYENPVRYYPGDTLRITCGYDTRTADDTVTWGEGTRDEMCLNGFYATL